MENKERFKIIPAVYLVLIRNNNILLSRRFNTGYEDGNYGLPAGHHDGSETMRESTAREAIEEIGIKVDPLKLEHILTMHRWSGDHERIDIYFKANDWQGEIKNMELDKCDDLSWFALNKLPKDMVPEVGFAIDCYLKGVRYSEFGWENKR